MFAIWKHVRIPEACSYPGAVAPALAARERRQGHCSGGKLYMRAVLPQSMSVYSKMFPECEHTSSTNKNTTIIYVYIKLILKLYSKKTYMFVFQRHVCNLETCSQSGSIFVSRSCSASSCSRWAAVGALLRWKVTHASGAPPKHVGLLENIFRIRTYTTNKKQNTILKMLVSI